MLVKLQVSIGTKKAERSRSLLTIPEERAILCKGTKRMKAVMLVELMKEEGSKWRGFLGVRKRSRRGEGERQRPGDPGRLIADEYNNIVTLSIFSINHSPVLNDSH
jgi:hypothetical protein